MFLLEIFELEQEKFDIYLVNIKKLKMNLHEF